MRVISGKVRGMKLVSPDGEDTRPTLDRVKEAVFSMLLPYINESVVLDLFAGSGAMGIEALSRGAKKAVFVDFSEKAIACIKTNVNNAQMAEDSLIIRSDSCKFLREYPEAFDIIFIDPPYESGLYENVFSLIASNGLINDEGLIIAEWDYENGIGNLPLEFELVKEKKYGRVGISVLKRSQCK